MWLQQHVMILPNYKVELYRNYPEFENLLVWHSTKTQHLRILICSNGKLIRLLNVWKTKRCIPFASYSPFFLRLCRVSFETWLNFHSHPISVEQANRFSLISLYEGNMQKCACVAHIQTTHFMHCKNTLFQFDLMLSSKPFFPLQFVVCSFVYTLCVFLLVAMAMVWYNAHFHNS